MDYIDYRLGVYHGELGDFGSAGGAEFRPVRTLDRPFATVGAGEDGLARLAAGASASLGGGDLLLGGEAKTCSPTSSTSSPIPRAVTRSISVSSES